MTFATIGLSLLLIGEWLHHELYMKGAEFFITSVLDHFLERVGE